MAKKIEEGTNEIVIARPETRIVDFWVMGDSPLIMNTMSFKSKTDLLIPKGRKTAAEKATSPLHKYFCWDDTEAARRYRLSQAAEILRVVVKTVPGSGDSIRVYVALTGDRADYKKREALDSGASAAGIQTTYRKIDDVLSDESRRKMLLADAYAELAAFRRKYAILAELNNLLEMIDAALAKVS